MAPLRPRDLLVVFGRLGIVGFGGPPAHLAMMETELVRRRGWVSSDEFLDGLALCQILPGPASTQMAIYVGHLRGGIRGAVAAGAGFILPAFALLLGLSWAYVRYGSVPGVTGLFAGIAPAVLAILGAAAYRLASRVLTTWGSAGIAAAAFAATLARMPVAAVLIAAGLLGAWLFGPRPARGRPEIPGAAMLAAIPLAADPGALFRFFLKVGALTFGGGFVIVPFIEQEVVERMHWLTSREFLDGLALGQITPGPIVITAAFVGYKVAGFLGAVAATAGMFLPSFVLVLAAAPFLRHLRASPRIRAFLAGVNAAAIGAILAAGAALLPGALGLRPGRVPVPDPLAIGIFVAALALLVRWKVDVVWIVAGAGLLGVVSR